MTTAGRAFDWPGLMRLGMVQLRLAPEHFWSLTPAELRLLAGEQAVPGPLTRTGLAALLAKFPDERRPAETGRE